jgi:endonuclease YncB( thermonuclease family)
MPGFRHRWVPFAVVAVLLAGASLWQKLAPPETPIDGPARAVDGDTISIGNERVRLLGIDAPELAQSCTDAAGSQWPCGQAARAEMVQLLAGRDIACQPQGRDVYGRPLARCLVDGVDLAQAVVEAGLAISEQTYFPQQVQAQAKKLGIWAGPFMLPVEWRRAHGEGRPAPFSGLWDWLP